MPFSKKERKWGLRPFEQQWKGQTLGESLPSSDPCFATMPSREVVVVTNTGRLPLEFWELVLSCPFSLAEPRRACTTR